MPLMDHGTSLFRSLAFSVQTAFIRYEIHNNKNYIVVPCVSNFGDSIVYPVNSSSPEFIPSYVLELNTQQRNGRPVCFTHPQYNGNYCSANKLEVSDFIIGFWYNAKYEDNKVKSELWIDQSVAEIVCPKELEALIMGQSVEVSEGNFVLGDETPGEYQGKKFGQSWVVAFADHIALLRLNDVGACAIADGCGAGVTIQQKQQQQKELQEAIANRISKVFTHDTNNSVHINDNSVNNINKNNKTDSIKPTETNSEAKVMAKATIRTFIKSLRRNEEKNLEQLAQANLEGNLILKDQELVSATYNKLLDALRSIPGFEWIEDYDIDAGIVYYYIAITPGNSYYNYSYNTPIYTLYERSFTIQDSKAVLSDDVFEVEPVVVYQRINSSTDPVPTVSKSGAKSGENNNITVACGCNKTNGETEMSNAENKENKEAVNKGTTTTSTTNTGDATVEDTVASNSTLSHSDTSELKSEIAALRAQLNKLMNVDKESLITSIVTQSLGSDATNEETEFLSSELNKLSVETLQRMAPKQQAKRVFDYGGSRPAEIVTQKSKELPDTWGMKNQQGQKAN